MPASPWFWDRIAKRYARTPIADEAAYQKKLEITRTDFRPDSRVLEFGCGTGSTAILHSPFVGEIEAIDFSPKMIAIAEQRKAEAGVENVRFRVATLDDLAAPEASYDVVMGMSILHLLPERDAAIAEAFRLLKPGGVCISSTACLGDFMAWLRYAVPLLSWTGLFPPFKFSATWSWLRQ